MANVLNVSPMLPSTISPVKSPNIRIFIDCKTPVAIAQHVPKNMNDISKRVE